MVVNPATRQWADLPTSPEPSIVHMLGVTGVTMDQENDGTGHLLFPRFYLVYDPMAESSQHFEVFLIPLLGRDLLGNITIDLEAQEWTPTTFKTHVFSSRRWRWEERSLLRQGEPAGTIADMLLQSDCWDHKAAYFRGALYVHCQNDSVMRIALSNDKYQMMRSPVTRSKLGAEHATFYLGKSERGVYSALLYWDDFGSYPHFRVWSLKEEEEINDGNHIIHMEWVLKTNISLEPLLANPPPLHSCHSFVGDEWRVIRNYNDEELDAPPAATAHDHDNEFAAAEWDFDKADKIVLEANKDKATKADTYPVDFIGFHPYKNIVFFSLSSRTTSYNLSTSKVQQLGGDVCLPVGIRTCFPYTPCWLTMGGLFENS
ncbi:hypothetical protein BDA96_05G001500 [Sorghum bicolor]|uniref:Uncharacterized protein n=1 Tax=Sorghum bicolor TaxID=4558 RepID=A0A921UE48_SORBI|nr:hypothetical protein BDA96_05G001500 [Sorghum bicolor]